MNKLSKNQSGLIIESLLVVIIIAMIAFVGWYVYNANKHVKNNIVDNRTANHKN